MRLSILLVIVGLNSGCGAIIAFITQFDCSNYYADPRYESSNATNYPISNKTVTTNSGIEVDVSGKEIDLQLIDSLTADLETCLNMSIKRCGFIVKIAPDAVYNQCAGEEIFPCKAGDGFTPGCQDRKPCPCGCAGDIQYPARVVVASDLRALKHEEIHLVVRTADHSNPAFKCQ